MCILKLPNNIPDKNEVTDALNVIIGWPFTLADKTLVPRWFPSELFVQREGVVQWGNDEDSVSVFSQGHVI